ncbi:MAG: N-acetylmuramoyl-L-alanine amidase [Bacteroidota bacterium]
MFSQDKSIEFTHQYNSNDNYIGAKSEVLNVNYKQTSPFVMLSGYTTNLTFNGTAYYRLKINNSWEEWTAFPSPHEGDIIDRLPLGAVFIDNAYEDIQFKVDKADNSKFIFRLFFPEHTKDLTANKTGPTANKQLAAGCAQPAYQGRNDWCPGGDCPKSDNPSSINPTHIVVHHSAAHTTSSDFAAVVRGYWDYHVNTHGWSDIGYNWLVDPNGVLYEGRGDKILGAHSPCMNSSSTGICFIGNYEDSQPSAAGIQALKDFIAWDAADKGIDVKTSSKAGSLGVIDHISGHKDGKLEFPGSSCTATACPGANLHNKLQIIINDVSNYACYVSSQIPPTTPVSFSAIRTGVQSITVNINPFANADKYKVYKSSDNITFSEAKESASSTIEIDNLNQGGVYYFKVEAINNDGASQTSDVLAAMPSMYPSDILIVDGVERRSFDALTSYKYPLTQLGRTYSSATIDAVIDGIVDLNDFKIIIWSLLDESTSDYTFNWDEQSKVKNYIDNGGVLIVSGNEIGWDLSYKGNDTDKTFYRNVLKAEYVGDNPSPHNYRVKDSNGKIYNLVENPNDLLDGRWPDVIKPLSGASTTFTYDGVSSSTGAAGINYKTTNGGVEYLAFAIESVTNDSQRKDLLEYLFSKYSSLLSVDDSFIKQNISLYPNPTSGMIKISNPNAVEINKVDVYNIYGQKLQGKIINNSLDMSNFSAGIYLIRIEDNEGKQGTFKVIKN